MDVNSIISRLDDELRKADMARVDRIQNQLDGLTKDVRDGFKALEEKVESLREGRLPGWAVALLLSVAGSTFTLILSHFAGQWPK